MSINLKQNAEETLKQKLYDIAYNYYKQIYKKGIHAPVLRGRLEAAKDISGMFLEENDVLEVVERAKEMAKTEGKQGLENGD